MRGNGSNWLRLAVCEESRSLLKDDSIPLYFEIDHADYRHQSPPLSEEVRESLLDDLESA